MTLRDLAVAAEQTLRKGPHPERARLDAESLLLHAIQQKRAWLLAHWSDETDHDNAVQTQAAYESLIALRYAGQPIQYITGEAEFYGLPFAVAPGVLIPRPETEHLVEEVIRLAHDLRSPAIADIGTGSGAIAVALAHSMPQARIAATDLSPQALAIAQHNAAQNHAAERIAFYEGDLLAPLAGQQFQIIASNPPYIPLADREFLSVEVRDHEPEAALFAGEDGLAIYRRLIPDALALLAPNGWLIMEIGFGQEPEIEQLLVANGYKEIHFIADYRGIARVAAGRRS
jgi:release factor glutamine methyltransferase